MKLDIMRLRRRCRRQSEQAAFFLGRGEEWHFCTLDIK